MSLEHNHVNCSGRWGQELVGGRLYWRCDWDELSPEHQECARARLRVFANGSRKPAAAEGDQR